MSLDSRRYKTISLQLTTQMKIYENLNTYGYLASISMSSTLQTGALSILICTQDSTPTSLMTLMKNSPIYCASLYFPRASTAFKNANPFGEDTMKLMSGWRVISIHPSETLLTPTEGHYDLIGSRILSRSFFALTNNVVPCFSELGGT